MELDPHSLLDKVHPDLVMVLRLTKQVPQPFVIVQGLRNHADECKAVATGHSTTMHSRHLPNAQGVACAVDVAALIDGKVSWAPGKESSVFGHIAAEVKQAAHVAGIPVEWGGDWHSFKDWGHFQLPWSSYS